MSSEKHTVANVDYEIKSVETLTGWVVQIFQAGLPVGPRYELSFETSSDMAHYGHSGGPGALIRLAKSDLEAGLVKKR